MWETADVAMLSRALVPILQLSYVRNSGAAVKRVSPNGQLVKGGPGFRGQTHVRSIGNDTIH